MKGIIKYTLNAGGCSVLLLIVGFIFPLVWFLIPLVLLSIVFFPVVKLAEKITGNTFFKKRGF